MSAATKSVIIALAIASALVMLWTIHDHVHEIHNMMIEWDSEVDGSYKALKTF